MVGSLKVCVFALPCCCSHLNSLLTLLTDCFSDLNIHNVFPLPGNFCDPTSLPDPILSDIGASVPSLKNMPPSPLYTESVPLSSLGLSNVDELQKLGILMPDTPDFTSFTNDIGSEPEGTQYLLSD